jgi:hypothetical protein
VVALTPFGAASSNSFKTDNLLYHMPFWVPPELSDVYRMKSVSHCFKNHLEGDLFFPYLQVETPWFTGPWDTPSQSSEGLPWSFWAFPWAEKGPSVSRLSQVSQARLA